MSLFLIGVVDTEPVFYGILILKILTKKERRAKNDENPQKDALSY